MVWYLAQLFPRTYWTTYADSAGDHFTIWKMWLGRCYGVTDVVIHATAPTPTSYNPMPNAWLAADVARRMADPRA